MNTDSYSCAFVCLCVAAREGASTVKWPRANQRECHVQPTRQGTPYFLLLFPAASNDLSRSVTASATRKKFAEGQKVIDDLRYPSFEPHLA